MKKFLPLLVVSVSITVLAHANILRVGYFGTHINNVDYAAFGPAYTAAAAGDTVLVFPGITAIGQTLNKKLIIIGPGDWLDSSSNPAGNAGMQASTGVATVSYFNFYAGSEGSVVMGLEGGSYDVRVNDITIRRNRNISVYLALGGNTYTNLQVLENYQVTIAAGNTTNSSITNLNVSNNFIYSFGTGPGNIYGGSISNNVWAFDNTQAPASDGGSTTMSYNGGNIELGGGAYLVQNNIFESLNSITANANGNYFSFGNTANSVFNYNLALQTATPQNWGAGVGNVITPIANASKIFVAFPALGTSSGDGRYQLAAGSPALTVGAGNTAIGMFAGSSPYKLSLIPPIPSIYKLGSPQGNNPAGSTITIDVSTRGNN